MRTISLLLILVLGGCATAPPFDYKGRVGCLLTIDLTMGRVLTEPLIIVGEKDGVNEDGNPVEEWWVYFPERPKEPYLDTNGVLRGLNVPKSRVLLRGQAKLISGLLCKCPS